MKLIRVALPVPLNRYFDYLLPDFFSATKGARVSVPFGSQTQVGIVVNFFVYFAPYKRNNRFFISNFSIVLAKSFPSSV